MSHIHIHMHIDEHIILWIGRNSSKLFGSKQCPFVLMVYLKKKIRLILFTSVNGIMELIQRKLKRKL